MKKILVVVDMQNDFIDGPLGSPEARAIVDNVCEKIRDRWTEVIVTKDTHNHQYRDTQEGRRLPVEHCKKNSDGWYLNEKVWMALNKVNFQEIWKPTFGSTELVYHIRKEFLEGFWACKDQDIELTLVGVCTDICVISNALLLKTHYPEMKIVVDASCCAGSNPEKHLAALEVMQSCQIDVVNR